MFSFVIKNLGFVCLKGRLNVCCNFPYQPSLVIKNLGFVCLKGRLKVFSFVIKNLGFVCLKKITSQ